MGNQRTKSSPQADRFRSAVRQATGRGSAVEHNACLAEWQFIDKNRVKCTTWEKTYLLEYELAREAHARGLLYRSTATWQQLFGGQFPDKPFILLSPGPRLETLKSAFSKDTEGPGMHDYTAEWSPLSYHAEYVLSERYQARLEEITDELRDDLNLEDGQQRLRAAVAEFMAGVPDDAYELSVARVEMTIHFDYSDEKIKEAFADLLRLLRRVHHLPGKKDEIDAKLKQLATTRLYRIFGTVVEAQRYLADCDFTPPYERDSGWTQARRTTEQMLGIRNPLRVRRRKE